MAFVHRKLWSFKPRSYGPWKIVHRNLLNNIEKMGGNANYLSIALPFWEGAGVFLNYANANQVDSITSSYDWENRIITIADSVQVDIDFQQNFLPDNPEETLVFVNLKNPLRGETTLIAGIVASNSVARQWALHQSSSGDYRYKTIWHRIDSGSFITLGEQIRSLAINSIASDDHSSYINGALFQSSISDTAFEFPYNYNRITMGNVSGELAVDQFLVFTNGQKESFIHQLTDNPWQPWQPAPQTTYFLPQIDSGITLTIQDVTQAQSIDNIDLIQQHILSINPINQAQSIDNIILQAGITLSINDIDQSQTIDNIDLIQANILSINELNQNQTLDNITLSLAVLLQIADIAQAQNIDIVNLIQQNILSINGIDQSQTLDNIDLIQANLLSIDPIDQGQTLDNIVLETGVLLQIAGIAQSQIIDNIDLIQQNILSILDIDQSQAIDNIDLIQANILAIADLTQQQIIDNIVLSITRIEGKISISFILTSPGASNTLTSPGATITGE